MSEINNGENPQGEENNREKESESRVVEYFEYSSTAALPKVTEQLLTFYELMKVDKELTEIEEEKGDLPEVIEKQKQNREKLTKELGEIETNLSKTDDEYNKLKEENQKNEERISKYDQEKYNVKSNKEYDDIMKSIDKNFEVIEKNDKRIKEIDSQRESLTKRRDEINTKLTEESTELEDNQKTLDELNSQYEQEEKELTGKKEQLEQKLDENNKTLYNRINRTYKGEAVGVVRNGNCSGCFNSIPPQREIEIRTAEKIFTCQSCGRILIDENLVNQNAHK
jgi:predicted  nucleic acid-binding Zn-ribbon protein